MSDDSIIRKLNTEGADLLTLAGVNDSNLIELSRIGGVKVALRGETMTLSGPEGLVERAQAIGQRMIEAARQRRELTADDILRLSDAADHFEIGENGSNGNGGAFGGPRIALPGIRKVIEPKPAQSQPSSSTRATTNRPRRCLTRSCRGDSVMISSAPRS